MGQGQNFCSKLILEKFEQEVFKQLGL